MLLSTGERISCALCAMAICDLGHQAISLTGSQAGIVTDSSHTKARILDVRADRISAALERRPDRPRRRLPGRLERHPGRDHARPRRLRHDRGRARRGARRRRLRDLHRRRRRLQRRPADRRPTPASCRVVSFEEMLEMSASGAKVLQLRAVEYARNHGVRIHCRSSFEEGPGTLVARRGRDHGTTAGNSSHALRRGGARDPRRASATSPGSPGAIFTALADANVNVDMIIQNEPVSDDQQADLSFTVATRRPARGARGDRGRSTSATVIRPTSRSARSRSSAPGCAATPASPRRSSACSARAGSTSR